MYNWHFKIIKDPWDMTRSNYSNSMLSPDYDVKDGNIQTGH